MTASVEGGARTEFATGWKLVLTAFFGLALGTAGLFLYTQGLFIQPLQDEFGWTRGQAALMPTVFGLTMAIAYPITGTAVDRLGAKRVAIFSVLSLSLGFFALSQMQGSLPLYVAIVLFTGLCGSGTATSYVRLVGAHFDRARGMALGITMTGTGIGAIILPIMVGRYLQDHGWRSSYQVLALLALLALPLILIFVSEKRAEVGQGDAARPLWGLTLAETLRTGRFWRMAFSFSLAGSAVSGILSHFVPMLQDFGMTTARAGATMGLLGITVIIGRLATGYLCDKFFAPYVAASILALSAIGFAGMPIFGPGFAPFAAMLVGLGLGAEIDLAGYMSARYFGVKAYGGVLGVLYGMFGLGTGFGAGIYGALFDRFGNYGVAMGVGAGAVVLAILLILSLGAYPERKAAAA